MPDATAPGPAAPGAQARIAKTALRTTLLAARRLLSAEARQEAAVRLQAALLALLRAARPEVIAGYVPMVSEPGGTDLPAVLAGGLGVPGRLLLPVLRPDLDLDWAQFTGPASLSTGSYRPSAAGPGLVEPTGHRLGLAAIVDADLVIVPAVAVDRTGIRLGRGGGSYDRALARARSDALVVALLYDSELVDTLPVEPHDVRVSAAVRPTAGLTRLTGQPQPG